MTTLFISFTDCRHPCSRWNLNRDKTTFSFNIKRVSQLDAVEFRTESNVLFFYHDRNIKAVIFLSLFYLTLSNRVKWRLDNAYWLLDLPTRIVHSPFILCLNNLPYWVDRRPFPEAQWRSSWQLWPSIHLRNYTLTWRDLTSRLIFKPLSASGDKIVGSDRAFVSDFIGYKYTISRAYPENTVWLT